MNLVHDFSQFEMNVALKHQFFGVSCVHLTAIDGFISPFFSKSAGLWHSKVRPKDGRRAQIERETHFGE